MGLGGFPFPPRMSLVYATAMTASEARFPFRLDALRAAPLVTDPFDFVFVPGFLHPDALSRIHDDFPLIDKAGSFPVDALTIGPAFSELVSALESDALREAVAEKLRVDLKGRPTMVTVRGMGRDRDGSIHTDSTSKIVTLLIYCNLAWDLPGGRLRMLRGPTDLEDFALEVPPVDGNMVMFRRSDRSFHGHHPAAQPRRLLQLNWMVDQASRDSEVSRHRRTAWLKRLSPFG